MWKLYLLHQKKLQWKAHFGLDTTKLKGRVLLNLDGFEEDTIIIESAAFSDIVMKSKYEFATSKNKYQYRIKLTGLQGGHSGFDIAKNRGNAPILLAEVLNEIHDIEIASFMGGTKFNVIPSEAEAIIRTDLEEKQLHRNVQRRLEEIGRKELIIKIEEDDREGNSLEENTRDEMLPKGNKIKQKVLSQEQSRYFLNSVINFPDGVINVNEQKEVTTSVNLGVANLKENIFKVGMRSSREAEEKECTDKLNKYAKENNLVLEIIGHQPGFQTDKEDKIVKQLKKAFYKVKENANRNLKIESVHITVEIGIVKEKMPYLQVAIISPNIQGAHTTRERVEIASIERTTKWLEEFIELYNKS